MKLSEIKETTPLIKDFKKRLAKTAKQAIPIVNLLKVSRIAGASALPIEFVLENGQKVQIYVRLVDDDSKLDIFRIDINGKNIPLSGDYDNSYAPSFNASVDQIAQMILTGQSDFDKKLARQKVKSKRTAAPKNKAQQRNALAAEIQSLDAEISKKQKVKGDLENELTDILKTITA
ncbi:MAG: hypothetical protein Q4P13_05970 [Psychrobacter sp.]|nr:hypothetical protein [Psychrobacter sp.]